MIEKIELNGNWQLKYDSKESIEIQIPCAVETVMEEKDFYGPFYFQQSFTVAKAVEKKHFKLVFDGVSYACQIIVNGILICRHEGVWDAFEADVTTAIKEGGNILEVVVNKPDFNRESPYYYRSVLFGFIPDVMMPFGGIWKDVNLYILGESYFKICQADFSKEKEMIILCTELAGEKEDVTMHVEVEGPDNFSTYMDCSYEKIISIPIQQCCFWSPNTPALYKCRVILKKNGTVCDERIIRGGFRNIQIENGEILINGHLFYMRGILHWGCYPEKMTPNLSYDEVKDELTKIKAMGFNTVKHCLYFPHQYYYELCDELGIVTWQELPLWLPYENHHMERRLFEQYPKMLDIFMNYPGVSVVSIGCELDATVGSDVLNRLYHLIKERDCQIVICDNSGSGECFEGGRESKSDIYDYHFYAELYNLNTLIKEFTHGAREKKPWIFGEFNDSDTMRILNNDSEEKPWWQKADEGCNPLRKVHKGYDSDQPVYRQNEIFENYNIKEEVMQIEEISKAQMIEIRKFILETTRSIPAIKGYNITTIRDVPITTAGIFDDKMNPKISEEIMRQINGEVVIAFQKDLARKWKSGADCFYNKDRYHYFEGDQLNGRIVVSNRSDKDINTEAIIRLVYKGEVIKETPVYCSVKANSTQELGYYEIILPIVGEIRQYTLEISLVWDQNNYSNQWDIWSYIKELAHCKIFVLEGEIGLEGVENLFQVEFIREHSDLYQVKENDILFTTSLDGTIRQAVQRGVNVIYMAKTNGFLPIKEAPFYREGVVQLREHSITNQLLHKGYAGIQFFGVASSIVFDKKELEETVGTYHSLIRRYDARKFHVSEYLVEITYGRGTILATTLNLDGGVGEQPSGFEENKQAIWLLNQMVKYLEE